MRSTWKWVAELPIASFGGDWWSGGEVLWACHQVGYLGIATEVVVANYFDDDIRIFGSRS